MKLAIFRKLNPSSFRDKTLLIVGAFACFFLLLATWILPQVINASEMQIVKLNVSSTLKSGTPVAAKSIEDPEVAFHEQCIGNIKRLDYIAAITACTQLTNNEIWAGKAHAALAAIYNGDFKHDQKAAYRHAQQSAELGDPYGKFIAALIQIQGFRESKSDHYEMNSIQVMQWLADAQSANVFGAAELSKGFQETLTCRAQKNTFRLLDEPLFCLRRPEISELFDSKGMKNRGSDPDDTLSEVWQPGNVIATATSVIVGFDEGADGVSRLAGISYISDLNQYSRIATALTLKYGAGKNTHATEKNSTLSWQLAQGIVLELMQKSDGVIEIRYFMPERWLHHQQEIQRMKARATQIQAVEDSYTL